MGITTTLRDSTTLKDSTVISTILESKYLLIYYKINIIKSNKLKHAEKSASNYPSNIRENKYF